MESQLQQRRQLRFDNWPAVLDDLERLSHGYVQLGKWNLEQMALHLNDWVRYPTQGFPQPPWLVGLLMASARVSIGPRLLRKILTEGKMKDGVPTAPQTVYPACEPNRQAEAEALTQLRQSIADFQSFQGTIHRSPIFGRMDKATAERLQWIHFAHHLSWLQPTQSESPAPAGEN